MIYDLCPQASRPKAEPVRPKEAYKRLALIKDIPSYSMHEITSKTQHYCLPVFHYRQALGRRSGDRLCHAGTRTERSSAKDLKHLRVS